MALPVGTEGQHEAEQPSIARVHDCWLEGSHHTELDRKYADHIALCAPHVPYLVRESRQLLRRMVAHLVDQGVRQFLDLGSGIPTEGHVHEIAQSLDPACRVVYVDNDPNVVADGAALVADDPGVAFVEGTILDAAGILGAPETRELLDLTQPVAVLMIETLLYLHDEQNPGAVVRSFVDAVPSGSYVGIVHFSQNEELDQGLNLFSRMFGAPPIVTLRDREVLVDFFAGLELVEPGIVPVPLWRPDDEDTVRNPETVQVHAGLGRKL
ncbi:SAM-dependent methyltransferase [Prauserella cavernicola]|uniref:SAM-dependent methyltransferase n=1 Tax=Prauserella cavernicola TaxID=2800127 RepID=A0A934V5Y7_9PSEU|nr:SAM-dependent methyltransferase [Prauserella cavernicola]MBK1786987.1 SAM-dependent methyltransferase [Prauserella cavernicola]